MIERPAQTIRGIPRAAQGRPGEGRTIGPFPREHGRRGFALILFVLLLPPATAFAAAEAEVPIGCDLGENPSQDATLACYEDLDRDGDAALSREELDRLPRTRGRFDALDADGSGAISPAEFQDGIKTLPQRAGGKGV